MVEQASKVESLRQWYLNYIDHFRKEYEKLSPDDKEGMNNTNNFLSPCQIEIFWVMDPDYQLIIQSNFDDRPDKEIIINGPYKLDEFHSKAAAVLAEERWSRSLTHDSSVYEQIDTLGETMAVTISNFTETIKSHLFQPRQRDGHNMGGSSVDNTWVQWRAGNIGNFDCVQEIDKTIQQIRHIAKAEQGQGSFVLQPEPFDTDIATGFGIHFFPPITMRTKRKPTIKQLIRKELDTWPDRKNVFNMKIDSHQIIVFDDGFVVVEAEKKRALEILNLIMACGAFYDHKFYAVREHELAVVEYNKSSLTWVTIRGGRGMRAPLFGFTSNPLDTHWLRTTVKPETVQKILLKAEEILADKELAAELRLLNEGLTHFLNSEFAPSFIMGWTIIERYYHQFWKHLLNEKQIIKKRFDKLTDSGRWTFDFVLESLNLQGEIDNDLYKYLMDLKKKRNKFYHEGEPVTKNDAALCLNYAKRLIDYKNQP